MVAVTDYERRHAPSIGRALDGYYGALVSTAAVSVFLLAWQIAAARGWVNARYTSSPSQVVAAALDIARHDDFLHHAWVSLSEFSLGFAAALGFGLPLGLALGTSRRLRLFVDPPMMALYTAPRLTLLPILIIWLGIGAASKIAIVFLGAVFPIIVNTMAGVREADPRLFQAARAFGASRLDTMIKVLVPGALPAILLGVRLAIGRGVLSVVVGEMFVSEAGIGHQIMNYGEAMQVGHLMVYAFAISLFGYALTVLVGLIENRVRSWRPEP
jgi:ABC-type nitrate/sulfonate/bicarbonate transport system permease component